MPELTALHRSAGAELGADGVPVRYGPLAAAYRATQDGAVVIDRNDLAIVDMLGKDVRRFANGMFTGNFRAVSVSTVVESAWCDDRGRLLGLMRAVFLHENCLRVVLEGTSAQAFIEHFDRYVLVDDVEFVDQSADLTVLTVLGARGGHALSALAMAFPAEASGAHVAEMSSVWRVHRSSVPGVDLLIARRRAEEAWTALVHSGTMAAGLELVEVLRVEAGLVRWPVDMSDKQLPHEVGLRDRVLSFDKGCYVGQETINRLDVRGQAKKGLVGVMGPSALSVGDALVVDDAPIGTLSSVVTSPRFGRIGLAVVRKPHDEGGDAVARRADTSTPVRLVPLPFAVGQGDPTPQ